jgi:hypothetical protein
MTRPAPLCPAPHQVSSVGDVPLLRVATARLANAMIAVLGPAFSLGSPSYQRIKTLVTDRAALADDGSAGAAAAAAAVVLGAPAAAGAAEAVWAALEQVGLRDGCLGRCPGSCGFPRLLLRLPW